MAFTILTQGRFVSTGVGVYIPVPSSATYFRTTNLTQMPLAPATGVVIRGEWYPTMAVNDGMRWKKNDSTNALLIDTFATATASNGFTYISSPPQPEAALTGTTITNATPAVATVTNTYSENDKVVIYNSTGALMYSGMTFTISSVSGSGFTLLGLNTPGSAASAFTVRRVSKFAPVEPSFLYVTGVTKATQGVVTVSTKHNYVVGQLVEFLVPGSFGMVQLNNFNIATNRPLMITAVTDYTFTIDLDTTNFTAFAFPATALSPTAQLFATVAPAGQRATLDPVTGVQTGYNFNFVPFHSGQFVPTMYLAGGAQSPAGASSDIIMWEAWKDEN